MGSRFAVDALSLTSRKPGVAASRRFRRSREKRFKKGALLTRPPAGTMPAAMPTTDPVRLAVLVMEGLARASMRASFTGTEVRVAAPDAATAAIFEAAVAETARSRSTDRLIRIEID